MINGIINVNKPTGFTSFDVVAKLRGIFKQKKIGHTGTLDPQATGVLPVCIGNATRVCELLTDKDKVYEAVMVLGIATDTQDTQGALVSSSPKEEVAMLEEKVIETIKSFIGEYDQIPPMYSAKKVGGKKLYELARAGAVVERKPSRITIDDIEILGMDLLASASFDYEGAGLFPIKRQRDIQEFANTDDADELILGPWVHIRVHCKKGTYIRTLCHDIGERLGCFAAMSALKRLKVGPFEIDSAVDILDIEKAVTQNDIQVACDILGVKAVDSVFMQYPAFVVNEDRMKALLNGNELSFNDGVLSENDTDKEAANTAKYVRIYDENDTFYAIYKMDKKKLKPEKMFLPS